MTRGLRKLQTSKISYLVKTSNINSLLFKDAMKYLTVRSVKYKQKELK